MYHQVLHTHTLQTFVNRCLQYTLHTKWLDRVINTKVWSRVGQDSLDCQIKRRNWDQLGHTVRKLPSNVVQKNPECLQLESTRVAIKQTSKYTQTKPWTRRAADGLVCWLFGCSTSQQHASVSQGWICTDNFTCCHTEIEVADPIFYLTQSQYTDTGPTSPSADPVTPGAWQGSHWSANF